MIEYLSKQALELYRAGPRSFDGKRPQGIIASMRSDWGNDPPTSVISGDGAWKLAERPASADNE